MLVVSLFMEQHKGVKGFTFVLKNLYESVPGVVVDRQLEAVCRIPCEANVKVDTVIDPSGSVFSCF
jgi:hypothetical protein